MDLKILNKLFQRGNDARDKAKIFLWDILYDSVSLHLLHNNFSAYLSEKIKRETYFYTKLSFHAMF